MNNLNINDSFNKASELGQRGAEEAARNTRALAEGMTSAGEQAVRASTEAARRSIETAQGAMRAGLNTATQTFQQVTEQLNRSFGFGEPQSEELARQSSQNVEAVTQAAATLAQGAQEISREWFGLAQERLRKNMDNLNTLSKCRSVQDLVAAQSDLVRDNLQQVIDNTRRLSEVSVRVAQDATRTIQSQSNTARVSRAA